MTLCKLLWYIKFWWCFKKYAENKRKYEQIQQEQLKQIEQREALEAK